MGHDRWHAKPTDATLFPFFFPIPTKRVYSMKKQIFLFLCLFAIAVKPVLAADPIPLSVTVAKAASRVSFQQIEDGKLLVAVTDADDNAVQGLGLDDFSVRADGKATRVTAVEPMTTNKDVPLNVVLVVDNSSSMRQRDAVRPLLDALEALFGIMRPIDNIAVVVFDDAMRMAVDGRSVHARRIDGVDATDLRSRLTTAMTRRLTDGTYLHDAMLAGIDVVRQWPVESNKFMVVFSDGEDLNSSVDAATVRAAARGIENFSASTIDYMPVDGLDPFMQAFAAENNGHAWKARSAEQLLPIFREFSSTLLHRYVVSYRALQAPEGILTLAPGEVTVEEVTTIDSAPLLNYLFFEAGRSDLPGTYVQLSSGAAVDTFDETALKTVTEKYRHLLNIIGLRMRNHPEATITLVGCNADVGEERGRTDLSRSRAESVRAYLRYVWGIDSARMAIDARNLPAMPSTSRIPEGQAENRRVEFQSDHPAILDTVKSEYVEMVLNTQTVTVSPRITAEAGLAAWQIELEAGEAVLATIDGTGEMAPEYDIRLANEQLAQLVSAGEIRVNCRVSDANAERLDLEDAARMPVRLIKRQQQQAMRQGYKVREKYALILFDYDSAAIGPRNKTIVDRIVSRMQAFPGANVEIVGHTDNIGKEDYNQKLSERRAESVRAQIAESQGALPETRLAASGSGPFDPLYDNATPEGRSLNRTVTVVLEYEMR